MKCHATPLAGLLEIEPVTQADDRGAFSRLYCEQALGAIAPGQRVLQANRSYSRERGTLRGLHYQRAAAPEGKLICCLRGQVFDVAVDVRAGSPTLGQWHGVVLSAEQPRQLWLPPGFAHGFQTLSDEVELLYLHTAAHAPQHEAGLRFDDPRLGVSWPLAPTHISPRDQAWAWLDVGFAGEPF